MADIDPDDINEGIRQRLIEIREARGYSSIRQASFAIAAYGVGITPAAYATYENGRNRIDVTAAAALADFYDVPVEWLLSNAGINPIKAKGFAPHPPEIIEAGKALARKTLQDQREKKERAGDRDRRFKRKVPTPKASKAAYDADIDHEIVSIAELSAIPKGMIPLLDTPGAGAGGGGIIETLVSWDGTVSEAVKGLLRLPEAIMSALKARKSTDIICLPIKGDSMLPLLENGDFIFVDTRDKWPKKPGVFVYVPHEGGLAVKTLRVAAHEDADKEDPWVEVITENPDSRPREPSYLRASEITIIGRVVRKLSAVEASKEAASITAPSQSELLPPKAMALVDKIVSNTALLARSEGIPASRDQLEALAIRVYFSFIMDKTSIFEGDEAEISRRIAEELHQLSA